MSRKLTDKDGLISVMSRFNILNLLTSSKRLFDQLSNCLSIFPGWCRCSRWNKVSCDHGLEEECELHGMHRRAWPTWLLLKFPLKFLKVVQNTCLQFQRCCFIWQLSWQRWLHSRGILLEVGSCRPNLWSIRYHCDGMVGVDVVVHWHRVCDKKASVRWKVLPLNLI